MIFFELEEISDQKERLVALISARWNPGTCYPDEWASVIRWLHRFELLKNDGFAVPR